MMLQPGQHVEFRRWDTFGSSRAMRGAVSWVDDVGEHLEPIEFRL
jgi:hypothetical protein